MTEDSYTKEPGGDPAPSDSSPETDEGDQPLEPGEDGEAGRPASQLGKLLLIGAALTAIVVLFIVLLTPADEKTSQSTGRIHSFVVPAGTGERLDRGEVIEIVPRTLDVKVGDTLIIRNEDSRTHTVGPVVVRAGETAEQNFTRAGVVEGECTVHPEDKFTIRISE
ncbi:MAG: hypothetical protein DCC49_08950 [Acidobacteria bacterium]|nr:MAG: hypothetical protein DCC49_08950 [Acidobacteriota bacterium]